MKYIGTKDGRIIDLERVVYGNKVIHLNENEIEGGNWSGWYWKTDEYCYEIECRDVDIIKRSDTIEELIDEFCLYYLDLKEMGNNESWIPYATYQTIGDVWQKMREEIIEQVIKTKSVLYAAIWTEWGLKYVAKMNDKGELELL